MDRTREEAERIAILKVRKALQKRDLYGFVGWDALAHRKSGHVHVWVVADEYDHRVICGCCKEAQKLLPGGKNGLRYKTCDCKDCVACDPGIRMDLEQLTRS